jgi:hypothetical protein
MYDMQFKENTKYLWAAAIMLLLAFLQCYRTVHDLHWAFEPDFDRDIGYIRSTLDGHFGTDPNYAGQYMWYNPLLFLSETVIVKLTGLPINVVVARAGMFLNLFGPIAFFFMAVKLFDYKVALTALLSFLFLSSGNMPGWGGATYSPWPLADPYVQFIFYLNVYFCYKAFSTQKMSWFIVLGIFLGIGFLGHSAPTIIIILLLILLQGQKIIEAIKARRFSLIPTYFLQGFFTVVPFLIFSFPFLYYIVGKYHLHFINRIILQCAAGIFERKNTLELLKVNLTFSMFIAVVGFIWFLRNYQNALIWRIIRNLFYITTIMYIYEAVLPAANRALHITLPDTIPAFHYFFYLKALQSIFFAFGFIFLAIRIITPIQEYLNKKYTSKLSAALSSNLLLIFIFVYALAYYPIYSKRDDFVVPRQQALLKEKETDKIEVYNYISKNLPLESVLLCKHDQSLFPVMATGIKMVSVEVYFSNPYISYDKRESDRNDMISYLTTGLPASAEKLFSEYKVSYVLLPNSDFEDYKSPGFLASQVIFKNNSFTLLAINILNK